ncbi:MAG: hypothetical protein HY059_04545 [Proteobacteria bacterium]|nr:hypothetical protein [Pseudomonadota bacterium]
MRTKLRGICIFCSGGAIPGNPISKEHLWPKWMTTSGLLPKAGNYDEHSITFRGKTRDIVAQVRRMRQGAANTRTFKVVCKRCNETWMEKVESGAREVLTPLIKYEPLILDDVKRRILREWIALKILVAENNSFQSVPESPIYDQAVRNKFKEDRSIPFGMRIWIAARADTPKWRNSFQRHSIGLADPSTWPPPIPHNPLAKNSQTITWGIGRLLIYANATTDPLVYTKFDLVNADGALHRLWPLGDSDIIWLPRFFLGDNIVEDLAAALSNLIASPNVLMAPP